MDKIGFDNAKYLELQSRRIEERIQELGGKLYLEFGGKLFDDFHAARVLPGFKPDSKLTMLEGLKEQAEIIMTVNSLDIEANKLRADLGITYDADVMRLIDIFQSRGFYVGSVVMTRYADNLKQTKILIKKLEEMGIKVYRHYPIAGYPANVDLIVSDEGYGKNEFIETTRPLVVVTAPGPGSGKMATCLSQLYHEYKRGVKAGYAKYETFPVWNIPLNHPVNIAYEAATADLNDVNMIDPWHLEAYGVSAVNYNRDVEIFPVLNQICKKINGGVSPYKSPTDMGVNMAGYAVVDDEVCMEASKQEVIRRYYKALVEERRGQCSIDVVNKIQVLMNNLGLSVDNRKVVPAARAKSVDSSNGDASAIELLDGRIVTGKTSDLLGCSAAMLLNALKALAGIPDDLDLISPVIIEPIQELKVKRLGSVNPRLHTDEVLIALSICAATNSLAKKAMDQLPKLKGTEVHSTAILSLVDEKVFRKLGVNLTSEPKYSTKKLLYN